MQRERDISFSEKHQGRYNAAYALAQLFELSHLAYILSIQRLNVNENDAIQQMERFNDAKHLTRQMMLKHIQVVMALDSDFAEEVRGEVEKIKEVLGIE